MKILIHGIPEREDHINKMRAELKQQNLDLVCEVFEYIDMAHVGNLKAYMDSIKTLWNSFDQDEIVWHLQDDILLSCDFGSVIRDYATAPNTIYCGFSSSADTLEKRPDGLPLTKPAGKVDAAHMWYSFPCIGIPWWISKAFVDWLEHGEKSRVEIGWIANNKFDDSLFQHFMIHYEKEERNGHVDIYNISPNIVDHRDDLCGGSVLNQAASHMNRRSRFWEG